MAYLLLKQDSEALKDFDVYSSKRPMDTEVIKKKADIYFSKKDYQKALNEYNQLIHLDPLAPYFYNRSVLHEILGQKDLMMEDRQRAKNLGYAS